MTGSLKKRPAPFPPPNSVEGSSLTSSPHYIPSLSYTSHSRTPSDPMLGPAPLPFSRASTLKTSFAQGVEGVGTLGHRRSPSSDSSNSAIFHAPTSTVTQSAHTTTPSHSSHRFSLATSTTAIQGEGFILSHKLACAIEFSRKYLQLQLACFLLVIDTTLSLSNTFIGCIQLLALLLAAVLDIDSSFCFLDCKCTLCSKMKGYLLFIT